MLLADWFVRLAGDHGLEFGQRSSADDRFTIGDPNAFHVVADLIEAAPFLRFVASDSSHQDLVDRISMEASLRVDAADFGGTVWYSTELHEIELEFSPFSLMGPFLQRLGSQTRIAGWRRLGSSILLEFVEDTPEGWPSRSRSLRLGPRFVFIWRLLARAPAPSRRK